MIIWQTKKEKQFTKAGSQDLWACDGEVEGDLKISGTLFKGAYNYYLGVISVIRLGIVSGSGTVSS